MLPPMRGAGASIVSRAKVRVRRLFSPEAMNRRPRRAPDQISAQRRVDRNGVSLPFIPSIAETLEFCITTGYRFRHA